LAAKVKGHEFNSQQQPSFTQTHRLSLIHIIRVSVTNFSIPPPPPPPFLPSQKSRQKTTMSRSNTMSKVLPCTWKSR